MELSRTVVAAVLHAAACAAHRAQTADDLDRIASLAEEAAARAREVAQEQRARRREGRA